MEDTETFSELVGCKVLKVYSDKNRRMAFQVVTEEKKVQILYYKTYGDCCNHVFFNSTNGIKSLIDNVITKTTESNWNRIKSEDCDVIESIKWTLHTNNGYTDIEVRNEHNGYYGGVVRFKEAIDFVHIREFLEEKTELKEITEDFDY